MVPCFFFHSLALFLLKFSTSCARKDLPLKLPRPHLPSLPLSLSPTILTL